MSALMQAGMTHLCTLLAIRQSLPEPVNYRTNRSHAGEVQT